VAAKLEVATRPDDAFDTKKANVLVAIANRVSLSDKAKQLEAISKLEAELNPILQ
jgi:hypothetical protein